MANDIIKYVPPQMGSVASYSTAALRQSPIRLLIKDVAVFITVLPFLPFLFLPWKSKDAATEGNLRAVTIRDTILQTLLTLIELVLLIVTIPIFLIVPGFLFVPLIFLCILIIYLVALPTQGPRIVVSQMNTGTAKTAERHRDERWLFVNGINTGHSGLQDNVDRLSLTFGREVVGIHNQSYGMITDILECLVQRNLSYNTMDVRVACECVKACLIDLEVSKVVLVAHSQGGIIASMVLDELFSVLPASTMSKLVCIHSFVQPTHMCLLHWQQELDLMLN